MKKKVVALLLVLAMILGCMPGASMASADVGLAIVDVADTANYSESGTWTASGLAAHDGGSAPKSRYSTENGAWAHFAFPADLSAGTYEVYYYQTSTNTNQTVKVNGSEVAYDNMTPVGWMKLGEQYDFSGTGNEGVTINRTDSGYARATAVKYVRVEKTIDVVDPADSVNFTLSGTWSNSSLPSHDAADAVSSKYSSQEGAYALYTLPSELPFGTYEVYYYQTSVDTYQKIEVNGVDVNYDKTTPVGWYLLGSDFLFTGEAGEGVKITRLNQGNARATAIKFVLKEKYFPVGSELICTATVPSLAYSYAGSQSYGVSTTGAYDSTNGYYYGSTTGCWMEINANLPVSSAYRVYFYSPLKHSSNDKEAELQVTDKLGNVTSIAINQVSMGGWLDLGVYAFDKSVPAKVRLVNHTTGQQIRFDTVKFVNVGSGPVALDPKIMSAGAVGEPLTASYEFVNDAGYAESGTSYQWFVSDTQDGTYTIVEGAAQKSYTVPLSGAGKFYQCQITPASNGVVGQTVATEPKQIRWKVDFRDEFDSPLKDGYKDEWIADDAPYYHVLSGRYPENLDVSGGTLNITTKKETRNAQEWTSGGVSTIKEFQYGYYEASYTYTKPGPGMNQSFWMMSRLGNGASDENGYEIDVNEGRFTNMVASNYHYYLDGVHKSFPEGNMYIRTDFTEEQHIWGCEWNENEIIMYLDGNEYRRISKDAENPAFFDQNPAAVYFSNAVMNTAWTGTPTDDIDGNQMKVDYFRFYLPVNDTKASLPYATNVTVTDGTYTLGSTVTAAYTYNSLENLTETAPDVKWMTGNSLDEKGWQTVQTASNGLSYTVTEEDLGKYLICAVKVKNENREGQYVYSNAVLLDRPQMAPKVQNLVLSGGAFIGGTMHGFYDYYDLNSDIESGSVYELLYADSADAANWTVLSSGTCDAENGISIVLPESAAGKYLKLAVTPKNNGALPNEGQTITSNVVGPVAQGAVQETIIRSAKNAPLEDYYITSDSTLNTSANGAYDTTIGYYYTNSGSVTQHLSLPSSAIYNVSIYHPLLNANNDGSSTIEVKYAGGTYTVPFNGRTTEAGWVNLGNFPFIREQEAEITIKVGEISKNIRIDTIRFINVSAQ